ncbi:ATPase inhibitor subunit zeta [Agrobacterium vitis]
MHDRDTRRRYLEERYILDFAMLQKTRMRRDELLAAWAAKKLGRPDLHAYLLEIRLAGQAAPGDNDVLQKVLADLRSKGVAPSEDEIRTMMNEMMFEAAEAFELQDSAAARHPNTDSIS